MTIIAQITDPHVAAPGALALGVVDTAGYLGRAVAHVNRLEPPADVVLVTGDLVCDGADDEYALTRTLLDSLQCPYYVIPGNHDEREGLRRAFADQGYMPERGFVQYVVEAGDLRLIALDTHLPGELGGRLCAERLAWLDARLAEAPERPTILFMHHPPFATGIVHLDGMGLIEGADGLGAVVARYGCIEHILCGHLHRTIVARWSGTVVSTMPSTAHQVGFTLDQNRKPGLVYEPPCVQVHWWSGEGNLVSHTDYIDDHPPVRRLPARGADSS